MARMGEGDKRWIVEDRSDGTNVHNWHWAETNCLDWAKNFFTKALAGRTVLDGEGNLFIKLKKVDKLDGEAYVNIRKGKIIPGYELNLFVSWEGEVKDSDGNSVAKADGAIEAPYIADENADEDPEVRVTVKDDGPVGKRLKDAFLAKGKPFVLEQVRAFVAAMARGGPAKEDLEVKKVAAEKVGDGEKQVAAAAVEEKKEAPKKEKEKKKEGFKTITMTEKFSCRAQHLFEILMDENRWKGFTQSNARISKEVNGEFSIFDGSVTGINMELQEGKLIVQKWRFGNWPDGLHSMVKLTFEEPEVGVTVVKLVHSDVPEEDRYGNATVVENTERGWRDLIFHRIRAVFGFGI